MRVSFRICTSMNVRVGKLRNQLLHIISSFGNLTGYHLFTWDLVVKNQCYPIYRLPYGERRSLVKRIFIACLERIPLNFAFNFGSSSLTRTCVRHFSRTGTLWKMKMNTCEFAMSSFPVLEAFVPGRKFPLSISSLSKTQINSRPSYKSCTWFSNRFHPSQPTLIHAAFTHMHPTPI